MADEASERVVVVATFPSANWHVRVSTIVIEDRRLGHATFRVYCCLRSFANPEGVCWPSESTIGKRLGMARSTVSEHLAKLVRCGYLRSEATSRSDKGRAANRYCFVPLSDKPTGGMSDHPTAPVGSSDGPRRISTDTPVGTAGIELDHQNITIELSPSTAREGGSVDDYWPGEEIASWAAGCPEFKEHPEFDPLDPEVIEDFKDYYRGEGKVSADWNASFKRWLRKELRYRGSGRKRRNERQKAGSMIEAAVNEVRKETEIDG